MKIKLIKVHEKYEMFNEANKRWYQPIIVTESYHVKLFNCVICGDKINLNEAYSNNGSNMICMHCFFGIFASSIEARKWINYANIKNIQI